MQIPTNEEKQAVHDALNAGKPIRVPLGWGVNSRIIVLDPALNPEGYTYEQMLSEPRVTCIIQSRFQEYCGTTLADTCDTLRRLPEQWSFSVENQNVYDGAYFGGKVEFSDGQVPYLRRTYSIDDVDDFMKQDYSDPLENPFIKRQLAFRSELEEFAADFTYLGRKGKVQPMILGFDGPLTAAAALLGGEIFPFMIEQPEKARELFTFITRAIIVRNKALLRLAGQPEKSEGGGLADDSIQLISTAMYEDLLLPVHELYYSEMSNSTPASRNRGMHLCGDATRHFPVIAEKLGVVSFDTGFPVDHGALRKTLGPDIQISGGPHVGILRNGSPQQCFDETKRILQSGVMEGGKFSLREGNNLPPCVPLENLSAVYGACLTYGWY